MSMEILSEQTITLGELLYLRADIRYNSLIRFFSMKISIVIPNYNGEKLLETNLPKVIKVLNLFAEKSGVGTEIVINDDGSSDRSVAILKTYENKKIGRTE